MFGNMGPEVSPRDSYGDTGWLTWGRETRSTFSGLTGLFFDIDKNGLFIVLGSNWLFEKNRFEIESNSQKCLFWEAGNSINK